MTIDHTEFKNSGGNTAVPFAFKGVVRLTGIGGGFLVFTVAVGFAAINTGNNSLYIGLAFLLGALLLSGLASKGGLKHTGVALADIDEAWAGQPAHGTFRLRNDSPIWNVRDVVITADELAAPLLIPILRRRSEQATDLSFLFATRGLVQLRHVDLYTRYPFGFFLKKRRVRIRSEVVVYPRLLTDRPPAQLRPFDGESDSANRIGAGNELHGFRDFAPGDSPRHLAWKKSASLGRWILKQTEEDASRLVHVALDPYLPPRISPDVLEALISETATVIHDALARGVDVVLTLPRIELRARAGESAKALFRELALLAATSAPAYFPLDRNTLLFAIGRAHEPKSA